LFYSLDFHQNYKSSVGKYQFFINKSYIFRVHHNIYMPNKEELTDEELEAELDKALKTNDGKKDHCGSPIPANKEVGLQRTGAKLKNE